MSEKLILLADLSNIFGNKKDIEAAYTMLYRLPLLPARKQDVDGRVLYFMEDVYNALDERPCRSETTNRIKNEMMVYLKQKIGE